MKRLLISALAATLLAVPAAAQAAAPKVTTGPATGVFDRGAALTGIINPNGTETKWAFQWGVGKAFDHQTQLTSAGKGSAPVAVQRPLALVPNTGYSYRLVARSAGKTYRGDVASFTTAVASPPRGAAKLSVERAGVLRSDRRLDVLAPISTLATGQVSVGFEAAGQTTHFSAPVDSSAGYVRVAQTIPKAQADRGTGILTLDYPGNATTQPQTVRLRAASEPAGLSVARPQIANGRLITAGTLSNQAHGVVRLQLVFTTAGTTETHQYKATIADGKFSFDQPLEPAVIAAIARRNGVVQAYTLFTGYLPARMRGEMSSFQVLPPQ